VRYSFHAAVAEAAVGRDAVMRAVASAVLQADALEHALLAALPLGPQGAAGGVSLPDLFQGELQVGCLPTVPAAGGTANEMLPSVYVTLLFVCLYVCPWFLALCHRASVPCLLLLHQLTLHACCLAIIPAQ
jgi:hypothetical protein